MPLRGRSSVHRGSAMGGNPARRGGRGGSSRGGRVGRANTQRGGYKRRFENQRVADIEESDSEVSEDDPSAEQVPSEEIEEESEEEQTASGRSYMALLQSFTRDKAPQAKRRKLNHTTEAGESASRQESESEPDVDRDPDVVEEAEDPEYEADPVEEDDEDDISDSSDPFETHFANPDQVELTRRLKAIKSNEWSPNQSELNGWRFVKSLPGEELNQSSRPLTKISGPKDLKLKQKLVEVATSKRPNLDALEQALYPLVFGYNDLLFSGRTVKNAEGLRQMTCLHALNHIFKTRDRVIKNNAKLASAGEDADIEARDQGFTRPKVLMILPTRQSAVTMVNTICSICEPDQQENRKRFDTSYLDKEAKFAKDRPEDFRELFEGNDDDDFRLGIKFTRKTIKYYSQFYNSDILMASPFGLRRAIGSEEDKKKQDYDFLSSIEVVIVDQADALLMQNWDHVDFIFYHLNRQPRDTHGADFMRVREWYLDYQAKYFRQTIILSAFNTPELSELHRQCKNWAGKVRVQPEYPGIIQELGLKAKQTFSRFEVASIAAEPDARFAYFTGAIVPALVKRAKESSGTLILVPSYLDFVRVRNYFATSQAVANLTFGTISEYADVPGASRARSYFLNGRHKILLYTERAHHFRRYMLNGVQRVIMYGLPDNPTYYKEIAGGFLAKSEQGARLEPGTGTVRVMFSKYDLLKLERIVGSKRVGKMIRERGDTFDFI